jgi:hypothetical protein
MLMIVPDHEKKPLGIFLITRVTVHPRRSQSEAVRLYQFPGRCSVTPNAAA